MHHLDELEYFPGTYVVDSSASATSNEYGVITSCNRFERTCQIKWFRPYEVGHGTFPTEVIRESEVSVYDIHDHPDYKFRPGNSVIRVSGFEDTEQTLQAVGQVVRLDPAGTVFVHWSDGSYTSSYPQDLYIVWDMSDYSNSSSEIESSSSEEYETSESNSNDSWETEEEEWKPDGAGGDGSQSEEEVGDAMKDEEERNLKFKDMDEQWTNEIKRLMNRITSCFEVISEHYTAVSSKAPDSIHIAAASNPALVPCLKRVLKAYRAWHKFEKDMKTGVSGCDSTAIVSLVGSIKYDIKREKSNKIKQHLAHVFESTNKSLLDQSKEVKKTEVATDTSDLQVTRGTGAEEAVQASCLASGMSNQKIKTEDSGTSVDMELGSSVDSASKSSFSIDKSGSPARAQDIEKDISCRLAATNVDESKDENMSENLGHGDKVLATASPANEGQIQTSDKQEPLVDSIQVTQLLEVLGKKLLSIQECMTDMEKLVKNARRKSEDKPEGKFSEEEEEKEKKDIKTESDSCPPQLLENGKVGETDMEVLAGTDVDVRADNLDACENASSSNMDGKLSGMLNGTSDEENMVDPPGMVLPQGFSLYGSAPSYHSYFDKTCMPSNPKKFLSAVKKELKLLQSSLPHGIIVKGYSDRMDLFSVLIDGPSDTPYEDGMFLFDVMLPHDYPSSPPLFHYISYESDRLNPNLYVDGKVCVSLLGTWSGKGMEVWTDQSNLLQVLVSIQGLILVDEPYYNEAGYEKQRGHQIALENSRMYNEMALLRLVEGMTMMSADPPMPFDREVRDRLKTNGPRMIARLRRWAALSESMGDRQSLVTSANIEKDAQAGGTCAESKKDSSSNDSAASNGTASAEQSCVCDPAAETSQWEGAKESPPPGHPHFPLLPMSKGFRVTLQKSLTKFEKALEKLKTLEGAVGASESRQGSCEDSNAALC